MHHQLRVIGNFFDQVRSLVPVGHDFLARLEFACVRRYPCWREQLVAFVQGLHLAGAISERELFGIQDLLTRHPRL